MSPSVCALIGAPVSHSLSPTMHEAAYASLAMDARYLALHVDPQNLGQAIAGARALGFAGLNVTAPHKEAVIAYCQPDALAKKVRAVNTIVFGSDGAAGTNTDVHGLEQAIDATGVTVSRAVIIGRGGAARAAAYVLDQRGVELTMYARSESAVSIGERTYQARALRTLTDLGDVDLVIDATPAGLNDEMVEVPIDTLGPRSFVLDLSVRASTPLSRAARARGARVQLGDTMLLHQGARAFTLFTGREAPLEAMRRALDRALDQRPRSAISTELQ